MAILVVVVAMLIGPGPVAGATEPAVAADEGGTFAPMSPVRVLDTRWGTGGVTGPVGAGRTIALNLSARIPADATAVVLNVTGVSPTASTYVTVFPHGTTRPNASNLNLVPGDVRPNLVTVAVGTGRSVDLYNNTGSTHLLADLAGYYGPGAGDRYTALPPTRMLDTRTPGRAPLGPGGTVVLELADRVPASATAVTLNLTGMNPTASTFVTAWPTGTTRPAASNLNLTAGRTRPNMVTVALGSNRRVSLYNNSGEIHLMADLTGFYTPDYGATFVPLAPRRVLDTRNGIEWMGAIDPRTTISFETGAPQTATAVLLNVTGVQPTAATYVGVWTQGGRSAAIPSTLNLAAGETAANLSAVALGAVNPVSAYNNAGSVHLVGDLSGVFVAPAATCTVDCAYTWGDNANWQLGTGLPRYDNWATPARVVGLSGVTALAGGREARYALRADGTVWAWGDNFFGELGNGWRGGRSAVPMRVTGLSGVTAIATGWDSAFALRADGTVWAWGANLLGELGNGTYVPSVVPVRVPGLTGVTAITAGPFTVNAVRADGTLWEWGEDAAGGSLVPVRVPGLTGITAAARDGVLSYALRDDGTVWTTWTAPAQVPGLTGVTAIAAGDITGYALHADGTVSAWGDNRYGQFGNGVTCNPSTHAGCSSSTPVRVSGLTGVSALAAGASAAYALRADGTAWAWGRDDDRGLGGGVPCDGVGGPCLTTVPVQVPGLTGVSAISTGGAVTASGSP